MLHRVKNDILETLETYADSLRDGARRGRLENLEKDIERRVAVLRESSLVWEVGEKRREISEALAEYRECSGGLAELFRFAGIEPGSRERVAWVISEADRKIREFRKRQEKETRELRRTTSELNRLLEDRSAEKTLSELVKLKSREKELKSRVRDLGIEMRKTLIQLESIEQDLSNLPENKAKRILTESYDRVLFDFLDAVNAEMLPSSFNRVARSLYDGVIRVNHHPQFVFKAYCGAISGLAKRGDLKLAGEKFADFANRMQNGYFDGILGAESGEASEREAKLREYVRDNLGQQLKVDEILGLSHIAREQEQGELAEALLDVAAEFPMNRDQWQNRARAQRQRDGAKKRGETRSVFESPVAEAPERIPPLETKPSELRERSRLLKWLAVSLAKYRIDPELARAVDRVTPLKVSQLDSRVRRLVRMYRDDKAMLRKLRDFQNILHGRIIPEATLLDLAGFQQTVFVEISNCDARIRNLEKPGRSAGAFRVVRDPRDAKTGLPAIRAAFGKGAPASPRNLEKIVRSFANAVPVLRSGIRSIEKPGELENALFDSFGVFLEPGETETAEALREIGLFDFARTLPPEPVSRRVSGRYPARETRSIEEAA
jgi:hypothetical protein